jgi:hypothetical protein
MGRHSPLASGSLSESELDTLSPDTLSPDTLSLVLATDIETRRE